MFLLRSLFSLPVNNENQFMYDTQFELLGSPSDEEECERDGRLAKTELCPATMCSHVQAHAGAGKSTLRSWFE